MCSAGVSADAGGFDCVADELSVEVPSSDSPDPAPGVPDAASALAWARALLF